MTLKSILILVQIVFTVVFFIVMSMKHTEIESMLKERKKKKKIRSSEKELEKLFGPYSKNKIHDDY